MLLKALITIGQEFQAVFLSTTEPTDARGNTTNPTKSPCDRYVFNTVLTRARSLVVVVGSPLILLKTEAHVVRLYGNKGKCWSVYLKKCLESNTFIIPSCVGDSEHQRKQFRAKLASDLGVKSPTLVSNPSSGNCAGIQQPVKHQPQSLQSSEAKSPPRPQQRQIRSNDIATEMKSQSSKVAHPSVRHDTSLKNITSPASKSKIATSKESITKPSQTPTADNKTAAVRLSSVEKPHGGANSQVNKIHSKIIPERQSPAASPREKNSPKTKSKMLAMQHQKTPPNRGMY